VHNEVGRMCNEAVVAYPKVILVYWHLLGGAEENINLSHTTLAILLAA
jgi:hypothetical protein